MGRPSATSFGKLVSSLFASWAVVSDVIGGIANAAALASPSDALESPSPFFSQLRRCPAACSNCQSPEEWTVYSTFDRLKHCNETLLIDFSIHIPLDTPDIVVRACSTAGNAPVNPAVAEIVTSQSLLDGEDEGGFSTAAAATSDVCVEASNSNTVEAELAWRAGEHSSVSGDRDDVLLAAQEVQRNLQTVDGCDETIIFGYSNEVVVGVFAGSKVDKASVASLINAQFLAKDRRETVNPESVSSFLQICGKGRNADYTVGVAAGNIASVQAAVLSWSKAVCVDTSGATKVERQSVQIKTRPYKKPVSQSIYSNSTALQPRLYLADCTTVKVVSGDICQTLAEDKCGITLTKFKSYNNLTDSGCNSLVVGQAVCCTIGPLPDIRPKPKANGECASYIIKSGNSCSSIAAANGLTVDDLDKFNKKTWQWNGCDLILPGVKICLSTGDPPLPAPVSNAICGPTKPGTTRPSDKSKELADLNPCPLNACCNIWGQCGVTDEFCKITTSKSGGDTGCISNCDWEVSIQYMDQFNKFKALKNIKRIVAFGGWAFSTEVATYARFREGVQEANREVLATKIVAFVKQHGLDGVDFDWEYPGAGSPDIPDIPPGTPDDGPNYAAFLKLVKQKLRAVNTNLTLSIAAPAGYWFLRAFHPLDKMAESLDYIVYMTYDLHGQWDYGGPWASSGCPEGNCLRSHVNWTETVSALTLITKTGVPASKILFGIGSYGRSFQMTDPGCRDVNCHFVGPQSGATPGRCTQTAGYISNAEINDITYIATPGVKTWSDQESLTNFVVYNGDQWVAYSGGLFTWRREEWARIWNFGGTSEWAIDLQEYHYPVYGDELEEGMELDDEGLWDAPKAEYCEPKSFNELDDIPDGQTAKCGAIYVLETLANMLKADLATYKDILSNSYDKKFKVYAEVVAELAPDQVQDFLLEHGNDYFTCVVNEIFYCAAWCGREWGLGDSYCRYITIDTCQASHGGPGVTFGNVTEPCPPDYSKRGAGDYPALRDQRTVYWSLRPDKADSFYKDLLNATGIDKNDTVINWHTKEQHKRLECREFPRCLDHGEWDWGPTTKGNYSVSDVTNPKEIIEKLLDTASGLEHELRIAAQEIYAGTSEVMYSDMVDSTGLPVLMIRQAVESMKQVVEAADEINKQRKKQMILFFLMAFLFLIPIGGSAIGAIGGLANLGRIVAMAGEAAMIGLDIYSVTQDPSQAPFLIFGNILSVGALKNPVKMNTAAAARRAMGPDDISRLGEIVTKGLGKIATVVSKVCR
ncbi:hypothetical protein B0T09DRAFT_372316 [Sordaria sp. MPI-SDFR-AT-0083]|nr:hypothetical protein B0T09DRAFT_372316 [Sordaria sp. MPI-SDFR-AT-0083]